MKLPLTILLFLFIVRTGFSQPDTVKNGLTKDLPQWMAESHVPCVGVGLIQNGKIVWIRNFGNLKENHPAPEKTLFNVASQTKPVTALLCIELEKIGKLDLDEPLSPYWTDPDLAGNAYLEKVTARNILSHQSGFPNWRTDNGKTKLEFIAEPGTKFGYSGEGYEYLRKALESKLKQPFDQLVNNYIFEPLKMNNSSFWKAGLDTARFAMWHDGQGKRYKVSIRTSVNAADDLVTTIEDYCKFGIHIMSNADTYLRTEVKIKENYFRCLGWGLIKGLPSDAYAFEHGGSDIGVRTMAVFLPETKSGIVIMTNGDNGMFISDRIIKRMLPNGIQILATMNKAASNHQKISISDTTLARYTGTYEQSNGKLVHIEQQGNALKISGDGVPTAILFPETDNKFFLDGYDVQMEFALDQSLTIYENGKQVMKIHRKK